MNRLVLCSLIIVNLVLVAVILTSGQSNQALAQYSSGGGAFISTTMKVGTDQDAQIVVDQSTGIMYGMLIEDSRRRKDIRAFDAVLLPRFFAETVNEE